MRMIILLLIALLILSSVSFAEKFRHQDEYSDAEESYKSYSRERMTRDRGHAGGQERGHGPQPMGGTGRGGMGINFGYENSPITVNYYLNGPGGRMGDRGDEGRDRHRHGDEEGSGMYMKLIGKVLSKAIGGGEDGHEGASGNYGDGFYYPEYYSYYPGYYGDGGMGDASGYYDYGMMDGSGMFGYDGSMDGGYDYGYGGMEGY